MPLKRTALDAIAAQLSDFVELFASVIGRSERRHWCKMYLSGLLLDGERKSIEPMADRVAGGDVQSMQQFVGQSPWDAFAVETRLRELTAKKLKIKSAVAVLDDTSLPKKGDRSVGVARQYCGALGKLSNCQSLVSLQGVTERVHFPLAARLYLPKSWTDDPKRMKQAGVPKECQLFQEKWRIALDLLDRVGADFTVDAMLFDAGYGSNREFLAELDRREMPFVGQIRFSDTFWDGGIEIDREPRHDSGRGRPREFAHPADRRMKPKSAQAWGSLLFADPKNIRKVTLRHKRPAVVEYVAMRVFEAIAHPFRRVGPERWLVVERLGDGTFKYYVASTTAARTADEIVHLAHMRWKVEQSYQQLKEELGLDHFEGRSWQGLHHHIVLCFMAFDFLTILAAHRGRGKKGSADASRHSPMAQ